MLDLCHYGAYFAFSASFVQIGMCHSIAPFAKTLSHVGHGN